MVKLIKQLVFVFLSVVLCYSCEPSYNVPQDALKTDKKLRIFPDYTDIVIPSNIAPLNFMVKEEGEEFVCRITSGKEDLISGSDDTGIIKFNIDDWHKFLKANKNKSLDVYVYVRKDGKWYE